jgi:hypothetical protein
MGRVNEEVDDDDDEDPSIVVEVGVEGCMTLNPRARESLKDLFCSWKNLGNSVFKYLLMGAE